MTNKKFTVIQTLDGYVTIYGKNFKRIAVVSHDGSINYSLGNKIILPKYILKEVQKKLGKNHL